MRVALDTSVLVAALVEAHPAFPYAAAWLDAVDRGQVELLWTTHAYAETWSVLTRLPLADRLDGASVQRVVDSLAALKAPEPLAFPDYQQAAGRCAEAGARSGAIFDALHLVVAERGGADVLLTLNIKDFSRLAPRIRLATPHEVAVPG